jgi:3-isopropylmalate/(R)-2-methylmalate dehydratase small subunit
MKPFTHLDARAAPLDIANLDTDQIIPKQFLKTVDREGLAKGLFYDLRFEPDGKAKVGFVLDDPKYAHARVLIVGENFGCGSSREHAPWALLDAGIRCVIASSFADIFNNNCFENGLLPVVLPEGEVRALMAEAKGGNHVFSIDLESQTVTSPSGAVLRFEIDPGRKEKLVKGLDSIGETLQASDAIAAFEARGASATPWLERAA